MPVTINGSGLASGITSVPNLQSFPAGPGLAAVNMPTGSIIQVVSVTLNTTYSASVATGAYSGDVTGLTPSITPQFSSSKILIMVNLTGGTNGGIYNFALYKNGSQLNAAIGAPASSRLLITSSAGSGGTGSEESASFNYLDSPATTSAVTYSVRLGHDTGSTQTLYINRSNDDANAGYANRGASTITLMEIR
jgi:hypothetical protein